MVHERIAKCLDEWLSVDMRPRGWRNPGWLAHPEAIKVIGRYFKYAAIHEQHNNGISWDCKTFVGHDGIHQTDSIQGLTFQKLIQSLCLDNGYLL